MSVTVLGAAVAALLITASGPGGPESRKTAGTSTRALQAEIKAMGPLTAEGAPRVVARMHRALVQPPGLVEADARTICGRFLPRVAVRVTEDKGASCELKLDALEALAMCHYLGGSLKDARQTVVEKLALAPCDRPGERGDGFRRAFDLAQRWFWPDLVRPLALARARGAETRDMKALDLTRRIRVGALKAFGERPVRGGLVVAVVNTGSPGAGAGLRVGDVILTVGARPVSSLKDVTALVGRKKQGVPLVYLRDGKRREGVMRGSTEGLQVRAVPERLGR